MIDKDTFKRECIRMMDSVREEHKGEKTCIGISCSKCPLNDICKNDASWTYFAFEIIEAVERWSKEHPLVTMEEKFEETFGRKPTSPQNGYELVCPRRLGFDIPCGPHIMCRSCKHDFWGSEYKEPKKEKEDG